MQPVSLVVSVGPALVACPQRKGAMDKRQLSDGTEIKLISGPHEGRILKYYSDAGVFSDGYFSLKMVESRVNMV